MLIFGCRIHVTHVHTEHVMRAIKNCGKVEGATAEQRVELMHWIEAEALRTGQPFGVAHYNCCIKISCQHDDMAAIRQFVQKMKRRGLEPDVTTYSSLVHAYAKRGDLQQSV